MTDFDELDELLEVPEPKLRPVVDAVEEGISLDDLLGVAIAEANQRKLARGTKPKDPVLAAAWYVAQAELTWEPQAIAAVYVEEHCECGHSAVRLLGWYRFDQHRREAATHRWVAVEQPDGTLDTYSHTIRKDVLWCKHCTNRYPDAAAAGFPVESLGEPCDCGISHQLELEL